METIRFIVEIDEQYVRDNADPAKMSERLENGGKNEAMRTIADLIAFGGLERAVNDGTTEFTISRDTIDQNAYGIFGQAIRNLAMLTSVCKKKDKEEEKTEE